MQVRCNYGNPHREVQTPNILRTSSSGTVLKIFFCLGPEDGPASRDVRDVLRNYGCCQDIPWQIPKDETVCINTKKDKPMSQ